MLLELLMLEVDPIEPEASFRSLLVAFFAAGRSLPFLWFLPISGLFGACLRQRDAALLTRLGIDALGGFKPDREAAWQAIMYYINGQRNREEMNMKR